MKCLLAAFASLLMLTGGASAGTIHVPGDALTIQGAIVMATSGDTILVAPGAYVEEIDLLGKQLVIEGTGGAAVTTIDANGQGRTVTVNTGEPAGTRLAGFTITGGTGGIVNLGELTSNCGGGLYVGSGAHLDLSDCMVTGNSVGSSGNSVGGGMAAHQSTVTVTGCTFSGNTGQRGAAFSVPTGGTLVAVSDCLFTGNTSPSIGVVDLWEAAGTITDCDVLDNVGDGLRKIGYGVDVRRCTFKGNTGWGYTHYAVFGGDVTDLVFLGNGLGGARCLQGLFSAQSNDIVSGSVFVNDTLHLENNGNSIQRSSFDGATIELVYGFTPTAMKNSIVRGSRVAGTVALVATYSDIEGLASGAGIIDADPLWVDAPNGDYSLLPASPCIDAGDPASPLDPDGTRADMGALAFENSFDDLGGGVAGTVGPVVLAAHSTLIAGDGVVFALSGTAPFQTTLQLLGFAQLGVPFKGGTLWPNPSVAIAMMTNAAGQLTLSGTWPAAVPSGFTLWAQYWHHDAGAVSGFASSNGVRGTVP